MSGESRIADLVRRLDVIASAEWRQRLTARMGARALDLVDRGFRDRQDPYGHAWKQTQRPNPILERTGALRSSFRMTATAPDHFALASDRDYAVYHQYGTARFAARRMIPTSSGGLGSWREPLEKVVIDSILEEMR